MVQHLIRIRHPIRILDTKTWIFPNPSIGNYFFLQTALTGNANVQLYNSGGQLLTQWIDLQIANGLSTRVDLPVLPNSSYWLMLKTDNGKRSWEPLIIQR